MARFPFSFRSAPERRDNLENPSVDLVQALVAIADGSTVSGASLTPTKALRLTAVYAAVRVVAESIATLPLHIRAGDGEQRERVMGDPRELLFNVSPNPEQTPVELLETWIANAMLWGKGYMYVERDNGGRPLALWTLRPDHMQECRTPSGQLYYRTTLLNGQTQELMPEQVVVLKAIFGLSPIMVARESVAGVIAADEHAHRFWTNNARPGGVIETSANWNDVEFEEFRRRWRAGHEGLKRSQLVGILSGGATWRDVGIPPQAAQMIEARKFGIQEISRLFRVPPHMIGELEHTATRATIEQQSIEFISYTLRPWLVRGEQALRNGLFLGKADLATETFAEFVTEGLLRGDIKTRYAAYDVGIRSGFMSRAEARKFEQMPAVDAKDLLDKFLIPLNMASSDQALDPKRQVGQPPLNPQQAQEQASALSRLALILRGRPGGEAALEAALRALDDLQNLAQDPPEDDLVP